MRYPRVKHSFAGRLTAWITITLLVVMLLITGVVSFLVKRGMTVEAEKRYQEAVGRMNERIGRLLSNVEVGVVNNVHDIEETLHEPEGLRSYRKSSWNVILTSMVVVLPLFQIITLIKAVCMNLI